MRAKWWPVAAAMVTVILVAVKLINGVQCSRQSEASRHILEMGQMPNWTMRAPTDWSDCFVHPIGSMRPKASRAITALGYSFACSDTSSDTVNSTHTRLQHNTVGHVCGYLCQWPLLLAQDFLLRCLSMARETSVKSHPLL